MLISQFDFLYFTGRTNRLYFYIKDEEGHFLKIKKDTFIRFFNEPDFLSKDRTKRFITKKKEEMKPITHTQVNVNEKIGLGDWIVIKNFSGIAQVLEFKEIGGKTIKQRRVKQSIIEINGNESKGTGMLLQYYVVKTNGLLKLANVESVNDSQFVPLSSYKVHVPPPSIINNKKQYNEEITKQLSDKINLSPPKCFSNNFSSHNNKQRKKHQKRTSHKRLSSDTENENLTRKRHKKDDTDSQEYDRERQALQNIQNRKRKPLHQ